jgi:hypothetical protein
MGISFAFFFSVLAFGAKTSSEITILKSWQAWNLQLRIQPPSIQESRHVVAEAFRHCERVPKAPVLILLFEGTAAYDARKGFALKKAVEALKGLVDTEEIRDRVYPEIFNISQNTPLYPDHKRWSGLLTAPLPLAMTATQSQEVDWWHFPSEEFEAVAYPERLRDFSLKQWWNEVTASRQNAVPGLTAAQSCIEKMGEELKSKTLIFLSHSSGVRTAIKFAEWLGRKYPSYRVPLSFSIDPVEEAQWAVKEVILQYYDLSRRFFEKGPIAVQSKANRAGLYKPDNVARWVSVYQNADNVGFDMPEMLFNLPKFIFGIHGSPVKGAANIYLAMPERTKSKAHGEICYHPTTLKHWHREFQDFLDIHRDLYQKQL